MSSGVPRGGGKGQRTDNVNMASNDGNMQNIPRMAGKNLTQPGDHNNMPNEGMMGNGPRGGPKGPYYNGAPNMDYSMHSNENMMGNYTRGGVKQQYSGQEHGNLGNPQMHQQMQQQPHFTAQANVPHMNTPNPVLFTQGTAVLNQEGPGLYSMHLDSRAQPNGMPHQQQYAYPPMQYQQGYRQPFYQPNQGYVPNMQQYNPNQGYVNHNQMGMNPEQQVPPMTTAPPAPVKPREKKILLIVDPESKNPVVLDTATPAKPAPATNPTPNTTQDADTTEGRNAFKKDFYEKFQKEKEEAAGQPEPSAPPLAQSEPKVEQPAPEPVAVKEPEPVKEEKPEAVPEEQPEPVAEPVPEEPVKKEESPVPQVVLEPVEEVTSALENLSVEDTAEPVGSAHPADPTVRDMSSLLQAPEGFDQLGEPAEGEEDDVVRSPTPDLEEEKRLQEEEEAERLRLREIELDGQLVEYQQNQEECNEETGSYSRAFMYCVRDIEREFKRTPLPVPLETLKNVHGIDIHSMPKQADGKKRADFNPPWLNKGNSMQGNRNKQYPGRNSHGGDHRSGRGGGAGKKPYIPRNSIDRAPKAQLQNRAEHAWKAQKINPEEMERETAKITVLLKAVRSLLNKITPTTKDDLIREFLQLNVSGSPPEFAAPGDQLPQVIDIIFDKALEEPRFCSLYSEICKRQVETELKINKQSPFRNAILTRSQATFQTKTMEETKKAILEGTDEEKKKEQLVKWEEDYAKFRRRKFGNINFIGQLYDQSLLSTKIITWCLFDLLRHSHPNKEGVVPKPPYDDESIQCATQLIEAVGRTLQICKDFNGVTQYIEQVFTHLLHIAPDCSPKIKFKILNLQDLRNNNWRQRKVVDQGPKKITEIHQEIQHEQQQQQQEREAYDRRQGGGIRQGGHSQRGRQAPPPARGSLDSRNPQNKRAMAGTASKLAPTSAGPRPMSMSINATGAEKKKSWSRGAAGGGTASAAQEAPGSRTIIARHSGSREGSESRKNSTMGEREAALAAAREMSSSNLAQRSNSQLSVASQEDAERLETEKAEREEKQKKLVNSVRSGLEELQAGDSSEKDVVEDLFNWVGNSRYGNPELADVFQRFTESYVQQMKPTLRPLAPKVLYSALAQSDKKTDIIKGIENYCSYAIGDYVYEDVPKLWELIAELIVNVLITTPESNGNEDDPKTAVSGASLNDFSPVFIAASADDRPNKEFSLLVNTLKLLAEQLAKKSHENLSGLGMDFEDLGCRKTFDESKLDAAMKACNVDVVDYQNLYDILHHQ